MPHDHSDPDHPHALLPSDPALRVKTLESLLTDRGMAEPEALAGMKAAWEAAYLSTPHGAPVKLGDDTGAP